ncbi:UPF0489 protein C5orf22-like [Thraustotheca clavata]|uniref:UPF0489 protein C5orf22-like n=1 Tax=Thraustotheca clavata TaxID=74557 RepID=A0A1V9ZZD1_9STRA|nr:UPF0489 protein C5orf22-like [Thraustotheca clavata]
MAQLEVHVVDDHHHVLEPIHKAIRRRVLPFNEFAIIHFDAHADLAFPNTLPADVIFRPENLYDELDASDAGIASFLLPLVYAGHMTKLIWVKPPWAKQMALGTQDFVVGKHLTSECLRLTSKETYFVEEGLYAPLNELTKTKSMNNSLVQLTVAELPMQVNLKGQAYILDICLDYFSTLNPFFEELKPALGEQKTLLIRRIYCGLCYKKSELLLPHDVQLEHYKKFSSTINTILQDKIWLNKAKYLSMVTELYALYESPQSISNDFLAFYELLCTSSEDDINLIKWAGPCMDLPHHSSSPTEIDQMLVAFDNFLTTIDRPRLITIAESKDDAYTPNDQVDLILTKFLAILQRHYDNIKIVHHKEI